jgi:TetR/AcrR family transcriptional repressor of nem operon
MIAAGTKAALMEHARELIQRVGVNAMSYADLSKAVGISKASIHHHFPRKDDLILALVEESDEIYGGLFRRIVDSDAPGLEKLRAIADIYQSGVCKDKMCLIGVLSTEYATLGHEIRHALAANNAKTVATFERAVRQGIAEGAIASRLGSADIAYVFHATILGASILARCSGGHGQFASAIEAFLASITR